MIVIIIIIIIIINLRVSVIPIVVGALGTVPQNFERRSEELEIKGRIETI